MKEGKDWREEGRLGKWGEVRRKGKAPAGAGGTGLQPVVDVFL